MPLVPPSSASGGTVSGVTFTGTAAAGQVPVASSSSAGSYQYPAGFEIAYDQITAPVNIVSVVEGAPTAAIAGTSHTYENVPYIFHFFCPFLTDATTANGFVICLLMQDGASVGRLTFFDSVTITTQISAAQVGELRLTPSAGAHTYGVSAYVGSATGSPQVGAGAGASGNYVPAFLRVTKC